PKGASQRPLPVRRESVSKLSRTPSALAVGPISCSLLRSKRGTQQNLLAVTSELREAISTQPWSFPWPDLVEISQREQYLTSLDQERAFIQSQPFPRVGRQV